MDFLVYGEPEAKNVILKVESYGGGVHVNVVDRDGYRISTLLGINEAGVTRYTNCDRYVGIALNEKGQIQEVKESGTGALTMDDEILRSQVARIFDSFNCNIGDHKIRAIKITRLLTDLGLKEAKDWVEANFSFS